MMLKKLLSIFFLAFSFAGFSQEMSIAGADITQCGGFLVDNGMSAGDYSNNMNETITICAEAPETIINLYWVVFALGPGDSIEIFDGPNTGSPSVGVFTGADLQTTDITSTNGAGCLTVRFISDGAGVGNFAAEISCGPPCERPFAIINTIEVVPLLVCPDESITFDASASTFANGAQMQSFQWVFDDGTVNTTSWPTVTHSFSEPGGYVVQLLITDNNDCNSANLPDHTVLVSTYPDFSLLSPSFDLCVGGSDYLGVNFNIPDSIYAPDSLNIWISEPWNDLPNIDLGGALFIPDDQTQCFSDEVTFSNFDLGQTIQSQDDIDSFYINFEHSFIGDITITFICPNGQSVIVHQQGGGGTFAGEPIDDDMDLDPGIGYDYWWSPDATNGTWEDNSGGTIATGTYESVQSFSNLVGCPLNGTWEVEICDSWGSDNGFIFDWGINFDPDLFGDLLSFTPIYGFDCDSTWWEGPFIIDQDPGCDFIQIEIDQTGSYDYTYFATNNFGCTFDTTITVDIFIAPFVNAGPDVEFGCDPVGLSATLDGDQMPYLFQWSPAIGLSDPYLANPILETVSGPVTYTLTGYPVGYPGCASSDEMEVTLDPSLPFPGQATNIQLCPDAPSFNMMEELLGNPTLGGIWLDPDGNVTDEIFDPAVDPSGVYSYAITYEDCDLSTPMDVFVSVPIITISPDTTLCIGGLLSVQIESTTDFNGGYQYFWSTGGQGLSTSINNMQTPQNISVYALAPGGCVSEVEEMYADLYDPLFVQVIDDAMICPEGFINLDVIDASGGYGAYTYSWFQGSEQIGFTENFDYDPDSPGTICLVLGDQCETPEVQDCLEITFEAPMNLQIGADTTSGCAPLAVNLFLLNDPATYDLSTLYWNYETGPSSNQVSFDAYFENPGIFDIEVFVESINGCANAAVFNNYIVAFAPPTAHFTATPQPATIEDPTIYFSDLSIGQGLAYSWQIFDGTSLYATSTESDPAITFPSDAGGIYDAQLTIVDANGCENVWSAYITINDIFAVYAPNAFTPNNDGVNDVFFVTGADIDPNDFELVILNRWGDIIFRSNDITEIWDGGYYKGSDYYAPNGVYEYFIKAGSLSTAKRVELKGTVLLMR